MDESGGCSAKKRKYKNVSFCRQVILMKKDKNCRSFSEMKSIKTKSEIKFSSNMTEGDVEKEIRKAFPDLENEKFSCAALVKVDNDTKRYEFHGSQPVWDGKKIKMHVRGKSNLYILEGKVAQPTSRVTHTNNSTDIHVTPSTSAHNHADSSHQPGGQSNINSLLSGGQALLHVCQNLEPQMSDLNTAMEIEENQQGSSRDHKDTATAAAEAKVEIPDCRSSSDEGYISPILSGMLESDLENLENKSEEDEQDTNKHCIVFSDKKAEVDNSSSDTGFDEVKADFFSEFPDIIPTSGPMEGNYPFNITFIKPLPDDVIGGIAKFEGVADVPVHRINPYTLTGTVPASSVPGDVPVTIMTKAGQGLGLTFFKYVDEMLKMVKQLVKEPAKQAVLLSYWSNEIRSLSSDNMHDQDSSVQTKQQQSVKVLQLPVYTAAQTDAQQFTEKTFSSSAGKKISNSYKNKTPLPEDKARTNGLEELAQFLPNMNTRLSKEPSGDVQSKAIDWLEFVKAVQKEASAILDESNHRLKHPCENDDNSSDYFADDETSSCGSFDLDTVWSDSEDEELEVKVARSYGPCIRGEEKTQRYEHDMVEEGTPDKRTVKKGAQLDNEENEENVFSWVFQNVLEEDIPSILEEPCMRDREKSQGYNHDMAEERTLNKKLVKIGAQLDNEENEESVSGSVFKHVKRKDISFIPQGPCIRDGKFIQEPTKKPVMVEEGTPNKKKKKGAQLNNGEDKKSLFNWKFTHFSKKLSKYIQEAAAAVQDTCDINRKSGSEEDSSFSGTASTSQEGLDNGPSSMKVNFTSINQNEELAFQLPKSPDVDAIVNLRQCSEEEKKIAASHIVFPIEEEKMCVKPVLRLAPLPKHHALNFVITRNVRLVRQVCQVIQRRCSLAVQDICLINFKSGSGQIIETEEKPGVGPDLSNHHAVDWAITPRVHLVRKAQIMKRQKWTQFVHTDPEELGLYKSYADACSKGGKKHEAETQLCELADQTVAIGPKLAEAFSGYLPSCGKDQDVLNLTPGIFSEFADVKQATKEIGTFSVLVSGRGDSEDFHLQGYDIAAKAITELKDMTYKRLFVGAPRREEEKVKEMLLQYGIDRSQLKVRCFKESREQLAELFCELDLAIMPSRTESFGLTALEALSAGLPVRVSGNSGLGEALKKVRFGSNYVVESDKPKEWAKEIRAVRRRGRKLRLHESKVLCEEYAKNFNWQEQCDRLVERMLKICQDDAPADCGLIERVSVPSVGDLKDFGPEEMVSVKRAAAMQDTCDIIPKSGSVEDSSFPRTTSTTQEGLDNGSSFTSSERLRVVLLSNEWRSSKRGLSTLNRELAVQLSKHPNVEVHYFAPQGSEDDKKIAASQNIQIIETEEKPDVGPDLWLSSLPNHHAVDCLITHGVHLAREAQIMKRHCHCKCIQFVHTDPEELGYADACSKGEKKHEAETQLSKLADQTVALGPKLAEAFSGYLSSCGKDRDVLNLTPGIFSEFADVKQATKEKGTFRVLVCGRGDSEDFRLQGYDIAAKAISELKDKNDKILFVSAPRGEEEKVKEMLLQYGIDRSQLKLNYNWQEQCNRLVERMSKIYLDDAPADCGLIERISVPSLGDLKDLGPEEMVSVKPADLSRFQEKRRKTGLLLEEDLLNLSSDLGAQWKRLAYALGIPVSSIKTVDEKNQQDDEKCFKLLLVWKQGCGSQATYQALETALRNSAVQRKDLAEKYCYS